MIGYVILGTNDVSRARSLYDALLAEMGVESRATVDRMHKKALELGGTDEGAPGLRAEGGDGFCAA